MKETKNKNFKLIMTRNLFPKTSYLLIPRDLVKKLNSKGMEI